MHASYLKQNPIWQSNDNTSLVTKLTIFKIFKKDRYMLL